MQKAIAYYRVSTEKQLKPHPGQLSQIAKPKTGLGLEAQQEAVRRFADREGYEIVAHYTEVESGKNNDRPGLQQAIAECKKQRCTLLIAKLDRLSRRVVFVASLMDSGVPFIVVEMPEANRFQLHIMAAFSEYERDQISKRTKAALAAAKERGTVLGQHGRDVLSIENAATADQFAQAMRPQIEELQTAGFTTVRALSAELNRLEIPTFREGGQWHTSNTHNLLKRISLVA